MNETRRYQAEKLFQEAVDLPPDQRKPFLDSRADLDPSVRREVEQLLSIHDSGDDTLDFEEPREEDELIGGRIGPYKVLQLIGEGGFGAVYMAEQVEPMRRKVALKIIKLGMDTRQVIARFEAERQALALMNHPGIAGVHDAGATESGRPYFVMELVKGVPITEYCDANNLSTKKRIALFIQVCRAVQHAHQKGVIHRDIKPSNILVTLHDGEPVPKVIDFGIARATDQELTEKTIFTRYGQFIGTPQYMSPEQAVISGQDVDTRSDIYSLGVLLYELMTGTTPFDAKTLRDAGLSGMQQLIREESPPTPSRRVSTLGAQLDNVARARHAEAGSLKRLLKGELDWIVMKALEKDRSRRYETASSLATDLTRHLEGDPVHAGPPSRIYRFRKLVARYRVAFAFLTVLFVLMAGFGIWMGVLYREAEQNLIRALDAEAHALAEADTAKAVSGFLVELLENADPTQEAGGAVTMVELLERGTSQIRGELGDRPELKATLLHTVGRVYCYLGLHTEAAPLLEEALAIRTDRLGSEDEETFSTLNMLGRNTLFQMDYEEARPLLVDTLEKSRRVLGNDHFETFMALRNLAWLESVTERPEESEALYREALEIGQRTIGTDHPEMISAMGSLAIVINYKDKAEAEALSREALEICRRLYGEDHVSTADALMAYGFGLYHQKRYEEAEPCFRQALEIRLRHLSEDNLETNEAMFYLAMSLRGLKRLSEAEEYFRRTMTAPCYHRMLEENNPIACRCPGYLGICLLQKGELAEGERLVRESAALLADHGLRKFKGDIVLWKRYLATALMEQGRLEEAESLLLECHAMLLNEVDETSEVVQMIGRLLVSLYETWGKPEMAAEWRARVTL